MKYLELEDIAMELLLQAKCARWRGGAEGGYYILDEVPESPCQLVDMRWFTTHALARLWSQEIAEDLMVWCEATQLRHADV